MTSPTDPADRDLCGWRVRSAIPIEGSGPWLGDPRDPDIMVTIHEGAPSAALSPGVTARPDGSVEFIVPDVASYSIDSAARTIVVTTNRDRAEPDVAVFLLTSVLAIVCHRRDRVPLHAAVVQVGGRTIALAGRTGAGKSTFAAMLMKSGAKVLADDVAVIDARGPVISVWSVSPVVRLWADAMHRLQLPVDRCAQSRPALRRYHVAAGDGAPKRVALDAVYHLEHVQLARHCGLRQLTGPEGAATIASHVWLRAFPEIRTGRQPLLQAATRILDVAGGHWLLALQRTPASLDDAVARILGREGT